MRSDRARRITLYSVRVYCYWTRECSDFHSIQYHVYCKISSYYYNYDILRPQTRYFRHQARPCSAMPNGFASTLTRAHNLHVVRKRTQRRKATKSILCLIYIYTPTHRLPFLPNLRFCAHFYINYNIYYIMHIPPTW